MTAMNRSPRPSRWIRRVGRTVFVATTLGLLAYGALVVRVAMLEPTIAIDSIARLRELQGLEGDDRVATGGTWPIYIEALEVTEEGSVFTRELGTILDAPADIVPARRFAGAPFDLTKDVDELIKVAMGTDPSIDGAAVEEARTWVAAYFEPRMARLRAAAREGPLGLRPVERPSGPQAVLYGYGGPRDPQRAPSVLEIPAAPHFLLGSAAKVFEIDARLAAARGDGQRAVESIKGVLEIADQYSESWEPSAPLFVAGMRIEAHHLAAELVEAHPEGFAERDLARLEATLGSRGLAETPEKSLARAEIIFADTLQHRYSDDGAGDGRILPHEMLATLDVALTSSAAERFIGLVYTPIAVMLAPTRAELAAAVASQFASVRADIALPPWRRTPDDANAPARASLASLHGIAIAASRAATRFEPALRLARDRAVLAIAIERFRRANDRGPRALSELVPAFLPALPIDPVTGVGYRSRIDEHGTLEVWSVGRDGVDDGGVFLSDARDLGRVPPSPEWWALHDFHARNGRFPASESEFEEFLASNASIAALPDLVEYRLEDGVPALRATAERGEPDVSVVRAPAARPVEREAGAEP